MNPYAKFLSDRDPLQVLPETAARLKSLVDTIGREGANRAPAPGKWSAREIICHLADCELVFAFRLRQALAEDHHVIQPFDQDRWAQQYAGYEIGAALQAFSAMRNWNIEFLKTVPHEEWSKRVTHPERGEMPFRTIVETMAGHDLNHVRQVEGLATKFAAA